MILGGPEGPIFLPGNGADNPLFPTAIRWSALVILTDEATNGNIRWSTDATAVAAVDTTGLITAGTQTGVALISATSGDGHAMATRSLTVAEGGRVEIVAQ